VKLTRENWGLILIFGVFTFPCHGSARGPRDQLRTKVVTTRSRREPMLQQAQTNADNFLTAFIHQLTKGHGVTSLCLVS